MPVFLLAVLSGCTGSNAGDAADNAPAQEPAPTATSEPTPKPPTAIPPTAIPPTPTPDPNRGPLALERLQGAVEQTLALRTAAYEFTNSISGEPDASMRGESNQDDQSASFSFGYEGDDDDEFLYIVAGERVLLDLPDLLRDDLVVDAPWLELGPEPTEDFFTSIAPENVPSALRGHPFEQVTLLLEADPASVTWSGDDFELQMPSGSALFLLPLHRVEPIIWRDLDPKYLLETSTVTGSVDPNGNIVLIETGLDGVLKGAAADGNTLLAETTVANSLEIFDLGAPVNIAVPAESDIAPLQFDDFSDGLVRAGDCYMDHAFLFKTRSCDEPHLYEVFSVQALPDFEEAPDEQALLAIFWDGCDVDFQAITGRSVELSAVAARFTGPSEATWALGNREMLCFIGDGETELNIPLVEMDLDRDGPFVSSMGIQIGECVADPELIGNLFLAASCDEEHFMEVFGATEFAFDVYPGAAKLRSVVDEYCDEAFEDYVGIDVESSDLSRYYVWPLEREWDSDHRRGLCFATSDEVETESFAGSAR